MFATASKDRSVRLWSPDGLELAIIKGFADEIWTLAWSPDGKSLACGLKNGQMVIVDIVKKEIVRVLESHKTGIPGIAWSPTGRLIATGSRDGTIRLWRGL